MGRALRAIFSLRTVRLLGLVVLMLALCIVLVVALDDVRGRISWSRYQEKARSRGMKIDLLEFVTPPGRDEENLAALPMFANAYAALQRGEEPENPFERPPFPKVVPGAGLDAGEKASLVPWRDGFLRARWISQATDNAAQDILTALQKVGPALDELHGGLQRPYARFPVEWEKGMFCEFPHLAAMDGAAYLLRLRSMAKLELGDSPGALADLEDLVRLSAALTEAPTVNMALGRISLQAHLLEVIWHGLAIHAWSDDQLRSVDEKVRSIDPLREWAYALDSERASVNRMFTLVLNGDYERLAAKHGDLSGAVGEPHLRHARKIPGWTRINQVRLNRHLEQMTQRVHVEEGFLDCEQALPLRPQLLTGRFEQKYYRAFIVAVPAIGVPEERALQIATRMRLATIALGLERFHRARGMYPERLVELVPAYLSSIPNEVTSLEPMRYRRTDAGGFLLYSVALNRRDDGGERAPAGRRVPPRDQPDWPWPAPPAK